MATPRLMIVLFVATGIVLIGVLGLMLRSWWALAGAVALHGLATVAVVGYAYRRASQAGDKPDPVSEARIEEEQLAQRADETHGPRSGLR